MIKRFALYGFLKNQKYYEPFLLLAFLEKGLNFTQIGILIGFRELCINLIEIPTGAIADLYGRRKCMIGSFISYILSFWIFAISSYYPYLFIGMFLFAIGEAFRTGTHKSMIFTWLKLTNQTSKKTQIYGYTRAWANIGSAISVILAPFIVIFTGKYTSVFYFSLLPYAIGILNFMSYPKELEGKINGKISFYEIFQKIFESIKMCIKNIKLRILLVESMLFDGIFRSIKDYIQPILKNVALGIPLLTGTLNTTKSASLIGIVYIFLHLVGAYGSKNAYIILGIKKHYDKARNFLWKIAILIYFTMTIGMLSKTYFLTIICFIGIYLLHNIWRPLILSAFDEFSPDKVEATLLSIESQAKSFSTMLIAPFIGISLDYVKHFYGIRSFGVVGLIALVLSIIGYAISLIYLKRS